LSTLVDLMHKARRVDRNGRRLFLRLGYNALCFPQAGPTFGFHYVSEQVAHCCDEALVISAPSRTKSRSVWLAINIRLH
jgi:hypothetical protein